MLAREYKIVRGFSLIELLVVIAIIIILAAAVLPLVSGLTRSNNLKQGVNVASVMIANGRALAMSNRRQVAVVFYEETQANATPFNANQTAIALAIEDPNQTQHGTITAGNTVFIPVLGRGVEYMPTGIRVATLGDSSTGSFRLTEQGSDTTAKARAIIFDENGQMLLRSGLARPAVPFTQANSVATSAHGDWQFSAPSDAAPGATSSPGLVVFDGRAFTDAELADDTARTQWLQQNATVMIINAYTGNILR